MASSACEEECELERSAIAGPDWYVRSADWTANPRYRIVLRSRWVVDGAKPSSRAASLTLTLPLRASNNTSRSALSTDSK